MKAKRDAVVEEFRKLQKETTPLLEIFQDPSVANQIQSLRDAKALQEYLLKNHNFKMDMIDTCHNYAKCLFEIGNYEEAAEYLYMHRILCQPSEPNYLNGLWGKLASDILMQKWEFALEDLKRLQQFIDESTFGSSLQTLQQRTWLIHWSLFVFFNHAKGRDLIIELFLYQKQYLNAIQTTCPWILRLVVYHSFLREKICAIYTRKIQQIFENTIFSWN